MYVTDGKAQEMKPSKPFETSHGPQDLVFAYLYSGLDFIQYFLTTSPFLPFAMVMYILSHFYVGSM